MAAYKWGGRGGGGLGLGQRSGRTPAPWLEALGARRARQAAWARHHHTLRRASTSPCLRSGSSKRVATVGHGPAPAAVSAAQAGGGGRRRGREASRVRRACTHCAGWVVLSHHAVHGLSHHLASTLIHHQRTEAAAAHLHQAWRRGEGRHARQRGCSRPSARPAPAAPWAAWRATGGMWALSKGGSSGQCFKCLTGLPRQLDGAAHVALVVGLGQRHLQDGGEAVGREMCAGVAGARRKAAWCPAPPAVTSRPHAKHRARAARRTGASGTAARRAHQSPAPPQSHLPTAGPCTAAPAAPTTGERSSSTTSAESSSKTEDEEQLWRFFYRRSGMGRLEFKQVHGRGRLGGRAARGWGVLVLARRMWWGVPLKSGGQRRMPCAGPWLPCPLTGAPWPPSLRMPTCLQSLKRAKRATFQPGEVRPAALTLRCLPCLPCPARTPGMPSLAPPLWPASPTAAACPPACPCAR